MIKHWLHPYMVAMRPSNGFGGQTVRTNPYNFVLRQLRCRTLGTAEEVRGRVASPKGAFVRSPGKHRDQALSRTAVTLTNARAPWPSVPPRHGLYFRMQPMREDALDVR
jgi:hypothetical protein